MYQVKTKNYVSSQDKEFVWIFMFEYPYFLIFIPTPLIVWLADSYGYFICLLQFPCPSKDLQRLEA